MKNTLAEICLDNMKNIIVVGDIHGDFKSFEKIKRIFNENDIVVFLGDYGDRGPKSVEVIEGMTDLLGNKNVIALKGNHENYTDAGEPTASPCTLMEEAEKKKGNWLFYFNEIKQNFLDKLYLAALIPNKILFVHGGVSKKINTIDDLRNPDYRIEEDVLWSDPCDVEGEHRNKRGAGVEFGPDISSMVTKTLGVKYIIRSHEPSKAWSGPCIEHGGRVVTISSTSIYGGNPFVLKIPVNKIPDSGLEIKLYIVSVQNKSHAQASY